MKKQRSRATERQSNSKNNKPQTRYGAQETRGLRVRDRQRSQCARDLLECLSASLPHGIGPTFVFQLQQNDEREATGHQSQESTTKANQPTMALSYGRKQNSLLGCRTRRQKHCQPDKINSKIAASTLWQHNKQTYSEQQRQELRRE